VVAIAVPVVVVIILLILVPLGWKCRKRKSNIERNKKYMKNEILSPTPFSSGVASIDTASIRAATSSKLSSGLGTTTQPPIPLIPAFSAQESISSPQSQSTGTQEHPYPPEQTSLQPNATPVDANPEVSSGKSQVNIRKFA
jgi:FtsZ-interacting cell division protein ZipA